MVYVGGMPRKPRVEYAGATYHVMSRGNRQQAVFRTDEDRETFLATLGEACGRTGQSGSPRTFKPEDP